MPWNKFVGAIVLYAFVAISHGNAQTFYANTLDSIRVIDLSSCTANVTPFTCKPDFFSMALVHDTLYFITVNDGLYRTFIKHPDKCEKVMDLRPLNSLTANRNGMLYGAMANAFVKIDVYNKTAEEYFMPYPAAGDMVFYKDKLYLAASPGRVVQVDIDDPLQSKVYIDLGRGGIYGLVSVEGNCNRNKVYALAANGVTTQLIQLDMENRTNLGVKCEVKGTYHDAASFTETGEVTGLQIAKIKKQDICFTSGIPASIQVEATGAAPPLTYQLNNGVSNTTGVFDHLAKGDYTIHITSNEGCATDTTITIEEGFCDVKLPSAFTPNGDKLNDVFRPLAFTPKTNTVLCIYNAWGNKIFETTNFAEGWDGKVNGAEQRAGTYIWTVSYTAPDNTTRFFKGTVELLR
ncbi:MAG: gliding motility-associated C-terminal domain-containing protein [Agriterribacter sp.]